MSTTDEERDVASLGDVALGEVEPQSVLDLLRQKREEISENTTADLPVPGYNNSPPVLYIRYHLIDGPTIERIGKKVMRQTKDRWDRQILAAMDTMIEAVEGFYIDMEDGSERRPLTLHGDHITTFGPEIQEALGFEAQNARDTVRKLFGDNDIALAGHNVLLSRWMGNTTAEINEDFLGGNL
jgi:hypothetical protein